MAEEYAIPDEMDTSLVEYILQVSKWSRQQAGS
jgi:hypothetical protein